MPLLREQTLLKLIKTEGKYSVTQATLNTAVLAYKRSDCGMLRSGRDGRPLFVKEKTQSAAQ